MQTSHISAERLVLSATRRAVAAACIAFGPAAIWLGYVIVQDGGTAWFGWTFAGLGVVMMIVGGLAMFARISLTLDRPSDLVRFSISGLGKRRNQTIPLSAVDKVELRRVVLNQSEHTQLVFVPKPESGESELVIREFWTRGSAEDAKIAIGNWLKSR